MSAVDATIASELQEYLRAQIPISEAMGVEVAAVGDADVRLRVPLEPNINHQGTVFGGSAAAAGILAGWALLHVRLSRAGHASRIVIQNTYVRYDAPLDGPFEAVAREPDPQVWGRFLRTFDRRRKARIEIRVDFEQGGVIAGGLMGSYVVISEA